MGKGMTNLRIKLNNESGQYLIKVDPIINLPNNMRKPDTVESIVSILLVADLPGYSNSVVYFDFDDFKNILRCTLFEFEAVIRDWVRLLGPGSEGRWHRVDILVHQIPPVPEEPKKKKRTKKKESTNEK